MTMHKYLISAQRLNAPLFAKKQPAEKNGTTNCRLLYQLWQSCLKVAVSETVVLRASLKDIIIRR